MNRSRFLAELVWSSWPTSQTQGFFDALAYAPLTESVYLAQGRFSRTHYHADLYQQLAVTRPATIDNAVVKRQAEFLAGRYLAKKLLTALNVADASADIGVGDARQPLWPNCIQGSITHSKEQVFCLISLQPDRALGIDVEHIMTDKLATQIGSRVYQEPELSVLSAAGLSLATASTLIFSAKESIYKALYPQVRQFFGFDAATLLAVNKVQRRLRFRLASDFAHQHQLAAEHYVDFALADNYLLTWLL
ncbi:4'-phosphopantetheinyl transferase family protein [Idiomarina xiamenensis]|uniref:Enterobactin synthase component D n=1 Tax=Idiomarina xiamenensis 10-D-4 TaxID=740709 RepID=K2KA90_9GAMM|nr:4'-phosphopantetheinyl transferase superfamily protein [Idiomarina xiamenensis]EKE84698.1 phosphopantetheinyl transferase [Idiomarina xiamenensis 10-D-4]